MGPLIVAILTASLLGSAHCAGMCGGFVVFALGGGTGRPPAWVLQVAYNGGRLVTYVALGALAGAVGAALDLGGGLFGWQRAAALLSGALMVAFGLTALATALGVRLPPAPLPEALRRSVVRGHARALQLAPPARAAVVGLLTTLLPCGWLYAFVITAAGTGSPLRGATAMAAFWLGTLPVLVGLGVGVRSLSGWLGPRLPALTALLVVGVGLYTLTGRTLLDPRAVAAAAAPVAPGPSQAAGLESAVEAVRALDAGEMPCCQKAAHGE